MNHTAYLVRYPDTQYLLSGGSIRKETRKLVIQVKLFWKLYVQQCVLLPLATSLYYVHSQPNPFVNATYPAKNWKQSLTLLWTTNPWVHSVNFGWIKSMEILWMFCCRRKSDREHRNMSLDEKRKSVSCPWIKSWLKADTKQLWIPLASTRCRALSLWKSTYVHVSRKR